MVVGPLAIEQTMPYFRGVSHSFSLSRSMPENPIMLASLQSFSNGMPLKHHADTE